MMRFASYEAFFALHCVRLQVSMAASILHRALEVQRMGEYIGAFELVVWAHMEGVQVRLAVGGGV